MNVGMEPYAILGAVSIPKRGCFLLPQLQAASSLGNLARL